MTSQHLAFALLVLLVSAPHAHAEDPAPYDRGVTAFVHVNVIPMDEERVVQDQTVIVRNGSIAAIGPAAEVRPPRRARVIDGRGRYLIPALADMHVHLPFQSYNAHEGPTLLQLFALNGVATIMNQLGLPHHLELRERVARGEVFGPMIWTSGMWINPPYFTTPEEVDTQVRAQRETGYDVIKIHGNLSREAYGAVVAAARRENMPLIGHIPRNLGVEPAIEERQGVVVHAEEYLYAYFLFNNRACCDNLDEDTRPLARRTARAGTWLIPTLAVYKGIPAHIEDTDAALARPEAAYLPPGVAAELGVNTRRWRGEPPERIPTLQALYRIQQHLVLRFHEAGVRMMVGTDAPANGAVLPGFSIHDEMADMVGAGLSPYRVLRAATVDPAEWRGDSNATGAVRVGLRADLILLDANPLDDIAATRRRAGVMLRGRWISAAEAEQALAEIASANARADEIVP
ncbi:MAG: amidohydrolase family protein [Vitreimonas sp.]